MRLLLPRITRSSGKVVWGCASRVEHGKKLCKDSPTLVESEMVDFLRMLTGTEALDPNAVMVQVDSITVGHDSTLIPA